MSCAALGYIDTGCPGHLILNCLLCLLEAFLGYHLLLPQTEVGVDYSLEQAESIFAELGVLELLEDLSHLLSAQPQVTLLLLFFYLEYIPRSHLFIIGV